ncbi:hypothetical protein DFH09DRAFT_1503927 [Mycena vulgaris]|nr:hypothetical protein DFH09DRAFT_1503927 [Mycena vulgaris]
MFFKVSVFTTVALAALSVAAPVAESRHNKPLPAILSQLLTDLQPVTCALSSINIGNATAEIVTPLTNEVQSILSAAISEVSGLAGGALSGILSTSGCGCSGASSGVLSVPETAKLLAPVLSLVTDALGHVHGVIDSTSASVTIAPLLTTCGGGVSTLLSTISPIVSGLVSAVLPLVSTLTGTLSSLGLNVSFLGSLKLNIL